MTAPSSLHIIGARQMGGAEQFCCHLINALHRHGHDVTAVTASLSGPAQHINEDIERLTIPMRSNVDLLARWRINRLVRHFQPSIVHTYLNRATALTRLPASSDAVHVARLGGFYKPKYYRHVDALVGVTRKICDYLIECGFPSDRVFHIRSFADIPEDIDREAARPGAIERLGIPDDSILIVAMGRLHPVKGFDDLLHAFGRLPREHQGRELHLAIGGDGPLRDDLQALATELRLTDRVHWLGWIDDTSPWYAAADLFVCPSRYEPHGNVILEAWAHRLPSVLTRCDGATELATHGEDAWIVERQSPESLAEGIQYLIEDDSLRASLADGGYRTLMARHSEEQVVRMYTDLYETLARRS